MPQNSVIWTDPDFSVWAKFGQGTDGIHPLVCHMVDVAMVAECFWRSVLPAPVRERIAGSLSLEPDKAEPWIELLCALHDIGKASPTFQLGTLPDEQGAHRRQLLKEGLAAVPNIPSRRHGEVGARVLVAPLQLLGVSKRSALALSTLLGGHHGEFPADDDLIAIGPKAMGEQPWGDYRRDLVERLAKLTGVLSPSPEIEGEVGGMLLAGLVSVSDWIGSSQLHFPYLINVDGSASATSLSDYVDRARSQARRALTALGWTGGWQSGHDPISFEAFFGFAPRPMQARLEDLASQISGPSITVVESPTGEGKTEAALYLADSIANREGERGFYFALPTQATSNQLLFRMIGDLSRRYPGQSIELQLLHGQKLLVPTFREILKNGRKAETEQGLLASGVTDQAEPDKRSDPGGVRASEWFTGAKRSLLAPFGVGTVDQAMLGAMTVRHVFVRLLGLSGKTIIIDEVHGYDPYMSGILERLLAWLGAIGSSVILLSATLPMARRNMFLDAYASGAGWTTVEHNDAVAYPRISLRSEAGEISEMAPISEDRRRTIRLRQIADPLNDDDALREIISKVEGGACVAVVTNTVRRAQELYLRASEALAGAKPVTCFHARFPLRDRGRLENHVISAFGKDGQRPTGELVIATQVIEQSLDLDFDLLVSDFAPAELLVQRAGRLHRHQGNDAHRPAGAKLPEMWVITPPLGDTGLPVFDRGTAFVYRDSHSLFASWLALRGLVQIRVPEDVPALVEAASTDAPEKTWSKAERVRWVETGIESLKYQESLDGVARGRRLGSPNRRGRPDFPKLTRNPFDDEVAAQTRLGADGLLMIPLPVGGTLPQVIDMAYLKLAKSLSSETISELMAGSVTISAALLPELMQVDVPAAFLKSPILHRARPVEFDDAGWAQVGGVSLVLDKDTGLRIIRTRKGA